MRFRLGKHLDIPKMAEGLIEALRERGLEIIKVGSVPPWMEKVSDMLPCGTVYRMKS